MTRAGFGALRQRLEEARTDLASPARARELAALLEADLALGRQTISGGSCGARSMMIEWTAPDYWPWTSRLKRGAGGRGRRGRRLPKVGLRPIGEERAQLKAMHLHLMVMANHEVVQRALWRMT